jgi:hypothetical protein
MIIKDLEEVNDVNRLIKNKAKYFKTTFIKYNAKNDPKLEKEVFKMLLNLNENGSKTSAKTNTILR